MLQLNIWKVNTKIAKNTIYTKCEYKCTTYCAKAFRKRKEISKNIRAREGGVKRMDGKFHTCSVKSAKIIPMIRTESEIGIGTQEDPVRMAFQYWDLNGKLIFIDDDYQSEL